VATRQPRSITVDGVRYVRAPAKPKAKADTKRTKRRSPGDGALFQRGDGMWTGSVEIPSADGKRRQKRVYAKDYKVAKAKLDELRGDIAKGMIPVSSTTTVAVWLRYWCDEIKKPHLRPNSYDWYDEAVRLHITPHIGNKKLRQLTPQQVREMLAKANTPGNAQRAWKVLKMSLGDAITEGLIGRNVAEAVKKPEHVKQTRGALTSEAAKIVIRAAIDLQAASDETTPLLATRWAAALLTGARPAELLGLEWSRVDFENNVLDLAWQLQQVDRSHGCGDPNGDVYPCGKKRAAFCPAACWDLPADFEYRECRGGLLWTRPKSDAGTRIVPIVAPLRAMLVQHQQIGGPNPHNLVWHRPDGHPLTRHDDSAHWRQVMAAAGQPPVDPYACRHTCATLLQELGVDEAVRMQIMGQSSAAAHSAYIHVSQDQSRKALGKLADAVGVPTVS
jgi:integrase